MLKDADFSYFPAVYAVCGRADLRCGIYSLAPIIGRKYKVNLCESFLRAEIRFTSDDIIQNSSSLWVP